MTIVIYDYSHISPSSQVFVGVAFCHADLFTDDDVVVVVLGPASTESYPSPRVLYYLFVRSSKDAPATAFAGEELEFRQKDYIQAAAVLRALAGSQDPKIRAGALVRLARSLRKAGRPSAALEVYEELAQLGATPVEGLPARLWLAARGTVFSKLEDSARLQQEAKALYLDLLQAKSTGICILT